MGPFEPLTSQLLTAVITSTNAAQMKSSTRQNSIHIKKLWHMCIYFSGTHVDQRNLKNDCQLNENTGCDSNLCYLLGNRHQRAQPHQHFPFKNCPIHTHFARKHINKESQMTVTNKTPATTTGDNGNEHVTTGVREKRWENNGDGLTNNCNKQTQLLSEVQPPRSLSTSI